MVNKFQKVIPDKLYKMIVFIFGTYVLVIILFPVSIFLAFTRALIVSSFIVLSGVSFRTLYVYLKIKKRGNSQKGDSIFVVVMFSSVVYHMAHALYASGIHKDATIGFLCMAFYCLSLVYLLSIRYSEAYKKNEEMSAKLVEAFYSLDKTTQKAQRSEIAFLQAQIKPHFLFNAMSSIISLCYTDGHRAGRILTELSKYLKDSFNIDYRSDYITIESELKLVESFVTIETERFGDRIKMEYDIEPDVLTFKIIPLVIEPLVENAIRHGILKNKRVGRAKLTIKKADEGIFICVEDNGKGIEDWQIEKITRCDRVESNILNGNGVSLININHRLKEFYNESLNFETNEEGTKVFFTVPIK
ncbi:MAG: histidine kinase, partial [Proteobacteria bacterium]|nr:histidine kinase [Pseudomonadota bacterium]